MDNEELETIESTDPDETNLDLQELETIESINSDETNLTFDELKIINERLDELLEAEKENNVSIEAFKTDFTNYTDALFSEPSESSLEQTETQLIILQSIDDKLTRDDSLTELSMYADLGILLILALITIGFTFTLIKYVFNSLTRHIR